MLFYISIKFSAHIFTVFPSFMLFCTYVDYLILGFNIFHLLLLFYCSINFINTLLAVEKISSRNSFLVFTQFLTISSRPLTSDLQTIFLLYLCYAIFASFQVIQFSKFHPAGGLGISLGGTADSNGKNSIGFALFSICAG